MPQPHTAHDFSRLISTSDDGRAIYGCSYRASGLAGCSETEVRQRNQPSPFAMRRAQRQAAKTKTRGGS